MKYTILMGSPNRDGNTAALLEYFMDENAEMGIEQDGRLLSIVLSCHSPHIIALTLRRKSHLVELALDNIGHTRLLAANRRGRDKAFQ